MDRGMVIIVGALLTFTSSWLGLVLYPYMQLQHQPSYTKSPGDEPYPKPLSDPARAGVAVYQANGCLYCHSQQVRSEKFGNWWEDGEMKTGADIRRGWGARRNVSRDYLHDRPTLLGTMRTGPDLANVGTRYAAAWQHNHLFNARSFNGWSTMPSFAFLYKREPVGSGQRSEKALRLAREWTRNPGYRWRPTDPEWDAILAAQPRLADDFKAANPGHFEVNTPEGKARLLAYWLTTEEEDHQIVPTDDAENLVAYLLELRKAETPLPEAKE
ncbi:MAG TPA: cbb3-type cytochrome c oxidase subunit II [Urbifossiella sp.]|jgi:cytochrome c oxidase cbb3-type subunit 2|nr:cbb3-type cytochrome c oxidase subunit II [Urbifossiella sp.]